MGLFDMVGGLLQQYAGSAGAATPAAAEQHFDTVAQHASPDLLSQGLSAIFRSNQTPDFAQLAAQMYGQATPEQKQALLGRLQSMLGPAAEGLSSSGTAPTTEAVQSALEQAHAQNPSVLDQVSGLFAQHPTLIKTLGGAALAIAMGKMAEHSRPG